MTSRALPWLISLVALLGPAPAPAAASIDEEVRAFLERWRQAQNDGDFAAYQVLYAPRFTGVRRSGPRDVRLDRAGWMKDRGRMFRKPMQVDIDALEVFGSAREARAAFVQRFAQGSYKDQGRKTIVLVRTPEGLRIVREVMHDSTIDSQARGEAAAPGDLVGLVFAGAVVLDERAEPGWASGAATLAETRGTYAASRPVIREKLPAAAVERLGHSVELVTTDGVTCAARLQALQLSSVVTPHFSTIQEWKEARTSTADRARDLVEQAGPPWLTARLDAACDGALLARRAGAKARVFPGVELARDDPEARRVLDQLRAHPAYATVRPRGRWEDPQHSRVAAFEIERDGHTERWYSAELRRHAGCAEWSGELWGLFRSDSADAGGKLTLLNRPGELFVRPRVALDLDGDGWPELIYREAGIGDLDLIGGIVSYARGRYQKRRELRAPYHDCPC